MYQYDPYGRMELGGEGHTDFYGYRAESYNPNTGLEYLRARYYNADKGRFFQEDTYLGDITDPLTLNRYAYVKNSPLNYADPSGHVAEYLTGPQYNPNDGWQANYYPLSQTGPEKTEFPIEIVSGTEAVKAFWGSVSEGLDHVMSQLKEAADLSLSQLRELRGWMKEAVEHSVVNVCENRVDLGAEIGETLLALISGALMGIDNAFNVPTDTMDEFFSSHALAYNIGKILGKSGTIAVLSLLAGLFLGGGAAAAGGATLALGGAMVAVTSSAIAIEWSALTAGSLSLSVSDHSSGSGEAEEGESYSYKNGTYEKADYHSGQTTGKKNPAPKDGQFALDNSVPIGDNTTRRVGIDSNGDFVVFDETSPGTFHGHIRTWNRSNGNQGLTQAMKNALYDAGYIKSSKGTSFKLTDYVKELIGK